MSFDSQLYVTADEWSGALQQLLQSAKAAGISNNSDALQAVIDDLNQFSATAPGFVEYLAEIARNTVADAAADEIAASLGAIEAGNEKLKSATAIIKIVSDGGAADAADINLTNLVSILNAAQTKLAALKSAVAAVQSPAADVLAKIQALEAAVKALEA